MLLADTFTAGTVCFFSVVPLAEALLNAEQSLLG